MHGRGAVPRHPGHPKYAQRQVSQTPGPLGRLSRLVDAMPRLAGMSAGAKPAPTGADASPHRAACMICALRPFCFPDDLPARLADLVPLVRSHRCRLARGELLFRPGDVQQAVYAVKAGFLMSRVPMAGGGAHVVAFAMVGDVLGLDAMGDGVHHSEAVALDACEVCEIPMAKFERLLEHAKSARAMNKMLGLEVHRMSEHAAALAGRDARQRVAGFLVEIAQRWKSRGYSSTRFQLPMARAEIGRYLGLTAETVTRELSRLRDRATISLSGKHLQIHDLPALRSLLPQGGCEGVKRP